MRNFQATLVSLVTDPFLTNTSLAKGSAQLVNRDAQNKLIMKVIMQHNQCASIIKIMITNNSFASSEFPGF
jgi:hypothetical protein